MPITSVITRYRAEGSGGLGLLNANEPSVVQPAGSGGVDPAVGLLFDSGTSNFAFGLRWGSGNGFADLSGVATAAHIHGPTASNAPLAFAETAGVANDFNGTRMDIHTLPGFDSSASTGSARGQFTFNAALVAQLQAGRMYFNVHTAQNGYAALGMLIAKCVHVSL